jgi:hypothetical protein
MGWYLILNITCTILPEFISFIENGYLQTTVDDWEKEDKQKEYENLPKSYKDIIDTWKGLGLGCSINSYNNNKDGLICEFEIEKKVTTYNGDLRDAYLEFLQNIIVYISSEISKCSIYDDSSDITRDYTDLELRHIYFRLENNIKSIEHTYNEDMTEIIETCVIYKRSIKKSQFIDLNRSYGFRQ